MVECCKVIFARRHFGSAICLTDFQCVSNFRNNVTEIFLTPTFSEKSEYFVKLFSIIYIMYN